MCISQELTVLMQEYPLELGAWVTKYRWPLLTDCQELQLGQGIVNFVLNPPTRETQTRITEMD